MSLQYLSCKFNCAENWQVATNLRGHERFWWAQPCFNSKVTGGASFTEIWIKRKLRSPYADPVIKRVRVFAGLCISLQVFFKRAKDHRCMCVSIHVIVQLCACSLKQCVYEGELWLTARERQCGRACGRGRLWVLSRQYEAYVRDQRRTAEITEMRREEGRWGSRETEITRGSVSWPQAQWLLREHTLTLWKCTHTQTHTTQLAVYTELRGNKIVFLSFVSGIMSWE